MKHVKSFETYKLTEGHVASKYLYHATTHAKVIDILKTNKFYLSPPGPADMDADNSKMFFLSCSREKYGGYAMSQELPVIIVLDGEKVGQRYSTRNVDYWGDKPNYGNIVKSHTFKQEGRDRYRKNVESEERIVSDNPILPNARTYILEIHVHADSDRHYQKMYVERIPIWISQILFLAEKMSIPVYVYEGDANKKYFTALRKDKSGTDLLPMEMPPDTTTRSSSLSFGDMEKNELATIVRICKARNIDELTDDDFRYTAYFHNNDFFATITNMLHTVGKGSDTNGKESVYSYFSENILPIMRKNKIRDIKGLVEFVRQKYKAMTDARAAEEQTPEYLLTPKNKSKFDYYVSTDSHGYNVWEYLNSHTLQLLKSGGMVEALEDYLSGKDDTFKKVLDEYPKENLKGLLASIKASPDQY